jgi:NAD(P)-dependent dehydrogenase (short-subunit alcohol dehydrogenase family)
MSKDRNMKNILITGVGSGLGEALADAYLKQDYRVYAIGRNYPKYLKENPNFFFFTYNLSQTDKIKESTQNFLRGVHFEVAILNAGVLGKIQTLNNTKLSHIKEVMDINLWANKELIDTLSEFASTEQIVAISSGASINSSKGWGAYSLSKSALNMLLNVYAKELPNIHFTALAPGVIETPMVKHIINDVDDTIFPSAKRLKEGEIQAPKEAAKRLIDTFPKLLSYESGSFLDIREM